MESAPLTELLYRMLESERLLFGVYRAALRCIADESLRRDWSAFVECATGRWPVTQELLANMHLDPDAETASRSLVKPLFHSWTDVLELAAQLEDRATAERFAVECVMIAELQCLQAWRALTELAETMESFTGITLRDACRQVGEGPDRLAVAQKWWRDSLFAQVGCDVSRVASPSMTA